MSNYREKNNKPKYVQKGTKFVEKRQNEPRKSNYIEKKTDSRQYKEKDTGGFDYDSSTITQTTVIPKLPKKEDIIPEPKEEQYKNKQKLLMDEIDNLKNKRRDINNSKFIREKQIKSSQQGGTSVFDQYEIQYEEVTQLKQQRRDLLNEINPRKTQIQKLTKQIERLDQQIRSFDGMGRESKEALEDKLQNMKQTLMKGALSPKDEKRLNHQIQSLKKELGGAKNMEDIEIQRVKLRQKKNQLIQRRDVLYKQKKPFSDRFYIVNQKFFKQNEIVKELIKKFDQVKKMKSTNKELIEKEKDQFFESKHQKRKQIDEQIQKIRDQIDAIWDEYDKKVEQYRKQDHLIKHIQWMTRQKEFIIRKKQREEKKKQWEEREKARKERQALIETTKPKKYTPEIKNCEFLIQYCEKLVPKDSEQKIQKQQQKLSAEQIQKKLSGDQQWKKEKGVSLIQSKKTKEEDVQIKPKKVRKHENQIQKTKQLPTNYTHDFSILNLFESIKTVAPSTQEDIQRVIKQLGERRAYYEKMNDDDVGDQKVRYQQTVAPQKQQPQRNEKKHQQKQNKLHIKQEDFPTL